MYTVPNSPDDLLLSSLLEMTVSLYASCPRLRQFPSSNLASLLGWAAFVKHLLPSDDKDIIVTSSFLALALDFLHASPCSVTPVHAFFFGMLYFNHVPN